MKIPDTLRNGMGRISEALQRFFAGRYGADDLSKVMLWTGLGLYILDLFFSTGILALLGTVLYALVIFRMLSRDTERRAAENRKYRARVDGVRTKYRQAKARFANRKEFKYVRCPKCRRWIRLPRGAGAVSVRCKPCDYVFKEKT